MWEAKESCRIVRLEKENDENTEDRKIRAIADQIEVFCDQVPREQNDGDHQHRGGEAGAATNLTSQALARGFSVRRYSG